MPTVNNEHRVTGSCQTTGQISYFNYSSGQPVPSAKDGTWPPIPYDFVDSRRTTVSANSPGWWKKVPKVVSYFPKSGKTPHQPKMPLLPSIGQPPILYPRRPKQSQRSWNRVQLQYRLRLVKFHKRANALRDQYDQSFKRYQNLQVIYNRTMAKIVNGVVKYKKVVGYTGNKPQNAYSRVIDYYSGYSGTYVTHWVNKYSGKSASGSYQTSGVVEGFIPAVNEALWSGSNAFIAKSNAITAATSRALSKLHDKLSNQSVHIVNIIAERHQTKELLGSAVKRLASFILSNKRKFLEDTLKGMLSKRQSKQLADDTLAFLFGVRPLINDVYGAAETVAHFSVDSFPSSVVVRGKASGSDRAVDRVDIISNGIIIGSVECETDIQVKVSFVHTYDIDNLVSHELSMLGLINPAEVAWEMMKWSFVIDWLIPIGKFLHQLSADAGLTYRNGVQTTTVITTKTLKRNYNGSDPHSSTGYSSWNTGTLIAKKITTSKERIVHSMAPSVRFPSFKNPFSNIHALEALALLRQRI